MLCLHAWYIRCIILSSSQINLLGTGLHLCFLNKCVCHFIKKWWLSKKGNHTSLLYCNTESWDTWLQMNPVSLRGHLWCYLFTPQPALLSSQRVPLAYRISIQASNLCSSSLVPLLYEIFFIEIEIFDSKNPLWIISGNILWFSGSERCLPNLFLWSMSHGPSYSPSQGNTVRFLTSSTRMVQGL